MADEDPTKTSSYVQALEKVAEAARAVVEARKKKADSFTEYEQFSADESEAKKRLATTLSALDGLTQTGST